MNRINITLTLIGVLMGSIFFFHLIEERDKLDCTIYYKDDLNIGGLGKVDIVSKYGKEYIQYDQIYSRGDNYIRPEPVLQLLYSLQVDSINVTLLEYNRPKQRVLYIYLHNDTVFYAIEYNYYNCNIL